MQRRATLIVAVLAIMGLAIPSLILVSVFAGSPGQPRLIGAALLAALPLLLMVATWLSRRFARPRHDAIPAQRPAAKRAAQPLAAQHMTPEQLAQVIKMTEDLTSSTNKTELFRLILFNWATLTKAPETDASVGLFLFDYPKGQFVYETGVNFDAELLTSTQLSPEDSYLKQLNTHREAVTLKEIDNLVPWIRSERAARLTQTTALILVPLVVAQELLGLVVIFCHPSAVERFQAQQVFFRIITAQSWLAFGSAIQAELAILDRLTHLYNHTYFQQRLQQELERCNRYKLPLSLLLIDIDNFKSVNDTYGHQQGDIVLQFVSRALGKAIRVVDFCARYGGEEFVVVLPETGCGEAAAATGAVQVAERIRKVIDEESATAHLATRVTVSIGVGVRRFPQDRDMSSAALIKQADEQLYRAKGEGKNRVCISPHFFPKPADIPTAS